MFSFFFCVQMKGAAVVSDMSVEWIWLQILKKSKQFVNRTWCIFMAERVGDNFPVTCLQLEFQAYSLITAVRYTGVTAGQNTLKLPCAYCLEIRSNTIRPLKLTSYNFYWWGNFKDQVYRTNLSVEQEFKTCRQILESVCEEQLHINFNPFH